MKKQCIILFMLVGTASGVDAQEYRTDVSIREQIKNNTVPGQQYSKEAPDAKKADPVPQNVNIPFSQQLKEGKLGMPVKTGGTTSTKAVVTRPAGVVLPSDEKPAAVKTLPVPVIAAPSQEELTEKPVEQKEGNVQPSKTKTE